MLPTAPSTGQKKTGAIALHMIHEDWKLVLPDRIELSTSPLPRECSTTELRQQGGRPERESMRKRPSKRPVLATRPPYAQARRPVQIDPLPGFREQFPLADCCRNTIFWR